MSHRARQDRTSTDSVRLLFGFHAVYPVRLGVRGAPSAPNENIALGSADARRGLGALTRVLSR